jgi:nucleoside-diphosphate-sugar epimerase
MRDLDLATDDLAELLRTVEVVYHAAAQPGISAATPFDDYLRNNVVATHRLLEAARRSDSLSLFVHLSTSSVYGSDASGPESSEPRPTSAYGVTKLAAEQLVLAAARDAGVPAAAFRLFSVYGPRERPDKLMPTLILSLLEGRPFPLFEGSEHHRRSYTYVGDIVEGLVGALDAPDRCVGEIFNLGNDLDITTGEAIALVEEILGRAAVIDARPRRAGDQLRTQADIAKARAVLGYAPRTAPRDGLAQTAAWFQQRLAQTDSAAPTAEARS